MLLTNGITYISIFKKKQKTDFLLLKNIAILRGCLESNGRI